DFSAHARTRELFVQDLYAGADPAHRLNARIFVEYAWHALFIRHLLRRPAVAELAGFVPAFTVINLPSFQADPKRHGVRSQTVIACNFAKRVVLIGGSSYANTILLSKEAEPELWAATNRCAAVLENVILDPTTRVPDFDDGSLTENTRSAYPLEFISNASKTGTAGHPKNIVMLTADAFG